MGLKNIESNMFTRFSKRILDPKRHIGYCKRREHSSQSYGTPKKRNKIRILVVEQFCMKHFFILFQLIPNMNRPGPARPRR